MPNETISIPHPVRNMCDRILYLEPLVPFRRAYEQAIGYYVTVGCYLLSRDHKLCSKPAYVDRLMDQLFEGWHGCAQDGRFLTANLSIKNYAVVDDLPLFDLVWLWQYNGTPAIHRMVWRPLSRDQRESQHQAWLEERPDPAFYQHPGGVI